jgi:hypothetical protein
VSSKLLQLIDFFVSTIISWIYSLHIVHVYCWFVIFYREINKKYVRFGDICRDGHFSETTGRSTSQVVGSPIPCSPAAAAAAGGWGIVFLDLYIA